MGSAASAHLEGDGGCYSVKCRSQPLSVNDRAVLRVTKQELRVLTHVGPDAVYDASRDEDRNVLLHLPWHDVVAVALAGRFLTVTQAALRVGLQPQVHLFKLQQATNVTSLVNLVRAHSEWRATRPFLEAGALPPPSRTSSSSYVGTPRRSTEGRRVDGAQQWRGADDGDGDGAWGSGRRSWQDDGLATHRGSLAAPPFASAAWASSRGSDGDATAQPPPLPPRSSTRSIAAASSMSSSAAPAFSAPPTWSVAPPPPSSAVAATVAGWSAAAPPSSAGSMPRSSAARSELLRQYSGAMCAGDGSPYYAAPEAVEGPPLSASYSLPPPPQQPQRAPPPPPPAAEPAPFIQL